MRSRPLGKSGLHVSELTLGTWGLSGDGYGPVADAEVERTFARALELDINTVDVAAHYGAGTFLKRCPPAMQLVVRLGADTTSPTGKNFSEGFLRDQVELVSEQLGRAPDVLLLHNPPVDALGASLDVLREAKANERARAFGVSVGSAEVALAALSQGAEVLSLAYNVFWQSDAAAIEPAVREAEAGLFVHSVLAYGLLSGQWSPSREFLAPDHRAHRWNTDAFRRRVRDVEALRAHVGTDIPSLRALALRFSLTPGTVASAIIGPRSQAQLEALVADHAGGPPLIPSNALESIQQTLRQREVLS